LFDALARGDPFRILCSSLGVTSPTSALKCVDRYYLQIISSGECVTADPDSSTSVALLGHLSRYTPRFMTDDVEHSKPPSSCSWTSLSDQSDVEIFDSCWRVHEKINSKVSSFSLSRRELLPADSVSTSNAPCHRSSDIPDVHVCVEPSAVKLCDWTPCRSRSTMSCNCAARYTGLSGPLQWWPLRKTAVWRRGVVPPYTTLLDRSRKNVAKTAVQGRDKWACYKCEFSEKCPGKRFKQSLLHSAN